MALVGKEVDLAWFDEFVRMEGWSDWQTPFNQMLSRTMDSREFKDAIKFTIAPLATYENPVFPDATVKVFRHGGYDKHHWRNPNPAAGTTQTWIIKCGDRQIGVPMFHLAAAKLKAKAKHDEMVAACLKIQQEAQPLFGRF